MLSDLHSLLDTIIQILRVFWGNFFLKIVFVAYTRNIASRFGCSLVISSWMISKLKIYSDFRADVFFPVLSLKNDFLSKWCIPIEDNMVYYGDSDSRLL